jgi:hypothetical protein
VATVGLAVSCAALAMPAPVGAEPAVRHAQAASATIGHLAYQTNSGVIDLVTVHANGTTSGRRQIAPIQSSTSAHPVTVSNFVAAKDGSRLAWYESRVKTKHTFTTTLVLDNLVTSTITTVHTGVAPLGFAGHTLVGFGIHVQRLVLAPSPHFVRIHSNYPVTTYAHGVVDTLANSTDTSATLRLTTLSGQHTALHHYTDVSGPDYRDIEQGWTSSDGKKLVVERGNHQDFGGLGPSSLVDEFGLHGSHHRTALGHYGTLAAAWRLHDVVFRGASDTVWAAFERLGTNGVVTAVAHYSGGTWHTLRSGAVEVAADTAGNLVVQPGKYTLENADANYYIPVATSSALLIRHGSTHALGVRGTQFFWVQG